MRQIGATIIAILLACLFLSFDQACAANYGFIRVRVVAQNPQRTMNVQLSANGHVLGPGFAHASLGFGWVAVTPEHLSRNINAKSTAVSAAYGALAGTPCEFDFTIEFSMDGAAVAAILGTFHAPSMPNTGVIPLAFGCGEHQDRLCSSDPALQRQIIEQSNRESLARYYEFKRNLDRQLEARRAAGMRQIDVKAGQLGSSYNGNFDEAQKLLEERVAEWKKIADSMIEEQVRRETIARATDDTEMPAGEPSAAPLCVRALALESASASLRRAWRAIVPGLMVASEAGRGAKPRPRPALQPLPRIIFTAFSGR